MNYKVIYDAIIENAKRRIINNDANYELHHIIPKSLGGTNDADNLILLSLKEHYVAHHCLSKLGENKMLWAFWMMSNNRGFKISANEYVKLRLNLKHTEETKRKISKANTGKFHTKETKRKIGELQLGELNHMFNKPHTEESKLKMCNSHKGEKNVNFGKSRNVETKLKIANSLKGKALSEQHKQKIRDAIKRKKIGDVNA